MIERDAPSAGSSPGNKHEVTKKQGEKFIELLLLLIFLSHSSVILRHMYREGVLSLTNFRTKSTTVASIRRKVFGLKMIFSLIVVPTDFPTQSTRDCSINVLGQVEDCQILETVSAFRENYLRRERVN